MDSFKLHFMASEHMVYDGDAESVSLMTTEGSIGILAHHSNLIMAVVPGIVEYVPVGEAAKEAGMSGKQFSVVSDGLLKVENNEVMIESFMEGTEITCGIYKTSTKTVVLPITEVVTSNEFFDYDAKYNGQVQEITPARIPEDTARRVAEETSRIYDILHANGIIRIDYIITRQPDGTDKIMMLEINTTPGMTPTSFIPQQVKAAGLNMTDVLTDIVENQF